MRQKKILIIFKAGDKAAHELACQISAWLAQKNCEPEVVEACASYHLANPPDLAIVLGGDGTILGIARHLAGTATPLLGINFGRVGFLTAVDAGDWRRGLEQALTGSLRQRACLALVWEHWRAGSKISAGVAVNDVVIGRGRLARLVTLTLTIDGCSWGEIRSDGIIITSPLGSSGYSVSAGGPILHPDLDVIGMTPVSPFMADLAPLVMPHATEFELRVDDASSDACLTLDGQIGHELRKQDRIIVRGWPEAIQFLTRSCGFLKRLRTRGDAISRGSCHGGI